jgi:hypothetical protein
MTDTTGIHQMNDAKKKYIPSHMRPGFDERKVKKLRPYKKGKSWNFTGGVFDSSKPGHRK